MHLILKKALEFYKKNKHTDKKSSLVKVLKKLGDEKKKLQKEMDDRIIKIKNVGYQGPLESVNENRFLDVLKDFLRKEEPTFGQMMKRYKKKGDFIKWFVKSQTRCSI